MPQSMSGVMREFADKQLHSGSSTGRVVTKRKQAIAIGLSEQRQQGNAVPHPHRNLGKFLHAAKPKLADQVTKLRSAGAFQAPRGAMSKTSYGR